MYRTIFDSEKKEWSGIKRPSMYNPSASIGTILLDIMSATPNKIAQVSNENKNKNERI